MNDQSQTSSYHDDHGRFRQALLHTEAETRFSARLIEKDYSCSVVLGAMTTAFQNGLVFKGGTSLSKVHAQFFRLSEDLDFAISVKPGVRKSARRSAIEPFKAQFAEIAVCLPCFSVTKPLEGVNECRQYNGKLSYRSVISGEEEHLKVETSLREEILLPSEEQMARTLLLNPERGTPVLAPMPVQVLALPETYAEKVRAALTRREPAIRDFFDIGTAVQRGILCCTHSEFVTLVVRKLAVAADDPVDLSPGKLAALTDQVEAQLKPVLRETDYEQFDLRRVVQALEEVVSLCGSR
jgi:predicted nucleotidyltransferase component of viral defense system